MRDLFEQKYKYSFGVGVRVLREVIDIDQNMDFICIESGKGLVVFFVIFIFEILLFELNMNVVVGFGLNFYYDKQWFLCFLVVKFFYIFTNY